MPASLISVVLVAPNPTDPPATFNPVAATWSANLTPWTTQANALATQANTDANTATTQASAAQMYASQAAASASAAGAATSIWVTGTTYAIGDVRWSPSNYQDYRRKTAGAGATDPANDSTNWQLREPLVGVAVGGINFLKGSTVASATTPDIWTAALGNVIEISGTTTTTGFATAPNAGAGRRLIAQGAWPLTHGANLILPGAVNYTCSAGDIIDVTAVTTTQFRLAITKADGSQIRTDGIVLLSTVNPSGASSVDFTNTLINATYDEYWIEIMNLIPTATSGLYFRMSTNNGSSYDNTSGNYTQNIIYNTVSSATPAGYGSSTDTAIILHAGSVYSTAASGGLCGLVKLYNPNSASVGKIVDFKTSYAAGAAPEYGTTVGTASRATTTAVNAIRFLFNGSTIASGSIRLFGVKK